MKIKRFFAADIRQAMRMVKEELGADAVIMSNRAVEGGIEIVAARDFDEQSIHNKLQEQTVTPPPAPESKVKKVTFPVFEEAKKRLNILDSHKKPEVSPTPAAQPSTKVNDKPVLQSAPKPSGLGATRPVVLPNFDAAKKRLQMESERQHSPSSTNEQNTRKFVSPYIGYAEKAQLVKTPEERTPAPSNATVALPNKTPLSQAIKPQATDSLLLEMSKELKYLRNAMDTKLANVSWAHPGQTSPVRYGVTEKLLNMGFSKKLSNMVANQLTDQNDIDSAFETAKDILSQALPVADDDLLESGGIVALVGPTGVGKTTTIAKLAAQFILKHGSNQVALITTDNYRIGAHEQLNTYGRILNIPVRVASCVDDLRNLIGNFSDKRLVLIDTAGMSQRNMKLVEQIHTLQHCGLPLKAYLVVSAATEYKAMNSIVSAFSIFAPQAAILTKVDEAITLGPALSSIIEHNLPMSFITDGQQVPEDFHRPDTHALIDQCSAEGDSDENEDDSAYQSWEAQAYA